MMSIMVHGSTVVLFTLDEDGRVASGIIAHDRASALNYCRSLGDRCDLEAVRLLEEALIQDPDVPAVSLDQDLVIPEDLVGEFAELLFVGSNVYSKADEEDDSSDPLEDLLEGSRLLYCYTNGPLAAEGASIGLIVFTNTSDEAAAMIVRSATEIEAALEELRHFSANRRDQVVEALKSLPRTTAPIYDLDPCTAQILAVGYLTRAKHASSAASKSANFLD